jgi:hypothetical protein
LSQQKHSFSIAWEGLCEYLKLRTNKHQKNGRTRIV